MQEPSSNRPELPKKYYVWIKGHGGSWMPYGNLHGYASLEAIVDTFEGREVDNYEYVVLETSVIVHSMAKNIDV